MKLPKNLSGRISPAARGTAIRAPDVYKRQAAVKAVEAVDTAVDQVVSAVLNAGGCAFITADHGNAEKMMNPDGTPFTAHTTNVVPFVAVGCGDVKLREGGCLADIAPTMLPYICLLYTSWGPSITSGCSFHLERDCIGGFKRSGCC